MRYAAPWIVALASVAWSSPILATARDPHDFAIAGIKIGMTAQELTSKLKTAFPRLRLVAVNSTAADGKSSYISAVFGQIPGEDNYANDTLVVLLTQFGGNRAYEVLRETRYQGAKAIPVGNLKSAVQDDFGLELRQSISGISNAGYSASMYHDNAGESTKLNECRLATMDGYNGFIKRLFYPLLADMHLWTSFYPKCGLTLEIRAYTNQSTPSVVNLVTEQLLDQQLALNDVNGAKQARAAALAKQDEDARKQVQGNRPQL